MTNKWLYSLIAVGILLALGVGVYAYTSSIPNPGHGGDSVLISINGQEKTIQQAVDDGDFSVSEVGKNNCEWVTTTQAYFTLTCPSGKYVAGVKTPSGYDSMQQIYCCDIFP